VGGTMPLAAKSSLPPFKHRAAGGGAFAKCHLHGILRHDRWGVPIRGRNSELRLEPKPADAFWPALWMLIEPQRPR
jgi:hypothetical protein